MFFGIVHPKVMALGVGVRNLGAANSQDIFEQSWISENRTSQLNPIIPLTTRDYVVNGREREALMV
jgi:hypothetical protein